MGKGASAIAVTVLVLMSHEMVKPLPDLCSTCAAGTFCARAANQTCSPCPENSYSSKSGQKACDICKQCTGIFRIKKQCSKTSDSECECIPKYSCVGDGCAQCKPDCESGQELTQEGCRDCASGTFYDPEQGVCRAWTNCSLLGKPVLVTGSKDKDVVCGPDPAGASLATPSTARTASAGAPGYSLHTFVVPLVLTSTAVVILVFILTLRCSKVKLSKKKLFYLLKQPFVSRVRTSQEEDACSYHFPEEEEGVCAL